MARTMSSMPRDWWISSLLLNLSRALLLLLVEIWRLQTRRRRETHLLLSCFLDRGSRLEIAYHLRRPFPLPSHFSPIEQKTVKLDRDRDATEEIETVCRSDRFAEGMIVNSNSGEAREALKFLFSPEGALFRNFLMDELVKSVDALSREQFRQFVMSMDLQNVMVPNVMPFAERPMLPLSPTVTESDRQVLQNIHTILSFLLGGNSSIGTATDLRAALQRSGSMARDLGPVLPTVIQEILPEVSERLVSRISARLLRDVLT